MQQRKVSKIHRRRFLKATAASSAVALAVPSVITASKSDSKVIVGEGDYQYEVTHDWAKLPSEFNWQTTHNIAVDKSGNVYVIHEGRENLKEHPSIFVFDKKGRFIRAFGNQFQGGGHGIEVRQEGKEEFLYVCAYQNVKAFAKLTLKGETVWHKFAPLESGKYAEEEATNPQKKWGPNRFLPTNFAFLDNGDFLLVDGYGAFYVHHYDKDGNWKSCWGGPGDGEGTFKTPHGIWIDKRGDEDVVVICDRAHHKLQYLTVDGKHIKTQEGFGLPANVDSYEDLLLVPELHARVTLLGPDNNVVAHLGDDVQRVTSQGGIRNDPTKWQHGKFVHPHDACFDRKGNIMVAEWVATGRVSKLTRL